MPKAYRGLLYALYPFALLWCVGFRMVLYLRYMDTATGFYNGGGPFVTLFNMGLFVFIALWFSMTVLRRTQNEYPVALRSSAASLLCALCGVLLLVLSALSLLGALGLIEPGMLAAFSFDPARLHTPAASVLLVLKLICGLLGGVSMLLTALRSRHPALAALGVFPAIWQIVILLECFTSFMVPTQISDNLLLVLFMTLSPLFLLGQARTMNGLKLSTSRNYLIPAGFAASLAGFSLIVPKLVLLLAGGDAGIASPLSLVFHIYVLALSVYAAVFLYRYIQAIKTV